MMCSSRCPNAVRGRTNGAWLFDRVCVLLVCILEAGRSTGAFRLGPTLRPNPVVLADSALGPVLVGCLSCSMSASFLLADRATASTYLGDAGQRLTLDGGACALCDTRRFRRILKSAL